jgi:hypothetical protein
MIENLVRQIEDAYQNDPSSPSLCITYLPCGNWYMSIVRYRQKFARGKELVVSASHADFETCLKQLIHDSLQEVMSGWMRRTS